jgi:hypothetical protein
MSDMKCPVCNVGYVHESVNHWCCDYEFCPSYDETDTETYDILIRTRKALDVALDALKHYCTDSDNWSCVIDFTGDYDNAPSEFADKAIDEITALEQKDIK